MADIVKRLRPRIVVPICMGSNPIIRPIKYLMAFVIRYFIMSVNRDENPQNAEAFFMVRARSEQRVKDFYEINEIY